MSETNLPKDLIQQLAALRHDHEVNPRQEVTVYNALPDLKQRVGVLCTWAEQIGKVAAARRITTNIDIVDWGISIDHPERMNVIDSGWKITVDPSISGGGDLSYRYVENPPIVSSRGVMLTKGRGRLAAFKAAQDVEFTEATVVSAQDGIVYYGDGFERSNIAYITTDTFPLPQFLDTWSNETGLTVLEHDLLAFAHKHNLDQ